MPTLRRCWRAGVVVASLYLSGVQRAAGEACVDQDERWAAHGSSCEKMKRLCDDKGYGPLVRKWCPRSCGLCAQDEPAPTPAPVVPPASEAAAAQPSSPLAAASAAPGVNSTPASAGNSTWDSAVHSNSSMAAVGTTTTTASAAPGTTTTTEAAHAFNFTANDTCAAEALAELQDDTAEAPLLYRYAVGPEALLPSGSVLEIEGPSVVELGPLAAQASAVHAIMNASGLPTEAGYNTTTTSTPWDFVVSPDSLREDVKASSANASQLAAERRDSSTTSEAISQLDAVLRGKRERHRSPRQLRPSRAPGRGGGAHGRRAQEEDVLWIEDPDAPPRDNASEALPLSLYDRADNSSDAERKEAAAGLLEKLLPRPAQTALEEEKRPCPEGYERVVGDVYGGDQWSGYRNLYAESKEECAQRCSRTPGCGSFEFSPTRKQCFRNSQTRPTHDKDRKDFVFCRRAPCPSFKTEQACVGPSVAADAYSAELSLRPGSYCIWSGGVCQAPLACTDKDCFLPDGGLPGMELPSWQTLWISRAGLEATMRKTGLSW